MKNKQQANERVSAGQMAETLKLVKRCPVCDREHGLERVRIVFTEQYASVLHITCPHCAHAILAVVGNLRGGIGLLGTVTDLNSDDIETWQERIPMNEDTLLNAVKMLSKRSRALVEALSMKNK